MNQFTGIIGIGALLGIAYLLSENKKSHKLQNGIMGIRSTVYLCSIDTKDSNW